MEIGLSRSALFHIKTKVFLKYFVRGCSVKINRCRKIKLKDFLDIFDEQIFSHQNYSSRDSGVGSTIPENI